MAKRMSPPIPTYLAGFLSSPRNCVSLLKAIHWLEPPPFFRDVLNALVLQSVDWLQAIAICLARISDLAFCNALFQSNES